MPDVVISNEGPVRKIRMNRPDKKNALTLAMYEAMAAAIEDAGTADGVRCVLIAGAPESSARAMTSTISSRWREAAGSARRSSVSCMRWPAAKSRWSQP